MITSLSDLPASNHLAMDTKALQDGKKGREEAM
jgi:hypothetical protein